MLPPWSVAAAGYLTPVGFKLRHKLNGLEEDIYLHMVHQTSAHVHSEGCYIYSVSGGATATEPQEAEFS